MKKYLKILREDVGSMSRREHFWYWVFPTILLSVLMAFFFSGVPLLVEIVRPELNREWGLLENIQLVVVLIIIGLAIYGAKRKDALILKLGFAAIALFGVFVFLEEIDYGSHLVEYLTGTKRSQLAVLTGVYNLHNYHHSTAAIIKRSVYVLMLVLFMIAPFVKYQFDNRLIRYLIPQPRIVLTATITIVCELTARALVLLHGLKFDELGMDIGEFSEILVYYVFMLYVYQLVFENSYDIDNTNSK